MYNVNKDIKQFKPYMRTRILFFVKCLLPVPASPLKGEEQKAWLGIKKEDVSKTETERFTTL